MQTLLSFSMLNGYVLTTRCHLTYDCETPTCLVQLSRKVLVDVWHTLYYTQPFSLTVYLCIRVFVGGVYCDTEKLEICELLLSSSWSAAYRFVKDTAV